MKLLNLGCGYRYHTDWTNVDFHATGDGVIAHNLLQGLPFDSQSFDVVYHAHVLEHFKKEDGQKFIAECHRVLKNGGLIRIAVPDLEQIARLYLQKLEAADDGNAQAAYDYEWMMLEMYDQTVRTQSGGNMAKYLFQKEIQNERFVYERIGEEGRQLRERFLTQEHQNRTQNLSKVSYSPIRRLYHRFKSMVKKLTKTKSPKISEKELLQQQVGAFRLGGEVHQWMYDRYSLKQLLTNTGFTNCSVKTAFDSQIPLWNDYELESKNGIVFKPDSLFIEANK